MANSDENRARQDAQAWNSAGAAPDRAAGPEAERSQDERPGVAPGTAPEGLVEQLAQAQAQAAEYLDSWRRSAAELSNARKRMQREQAEFSATASARLLEKLLPIVDDVDLRAERIARGPGQWRMGQWIPPDPA